MVGLSLAVPGRRIIFIVGGGTAGLVVAARLTENPDVKVGVIEAGQNLMDDPQVYTPGYYPTMIGREKYDWCFQSEPVPTAGNKTYSMPRGRLLGGSSGINYLMYVRGSRADYDGWEALGNKGWGWEGMVPYFKKHQTLDPLENAPKNPQFMPHAEKEKWHGTNGPIHTVTFVFAISCSLLSETCADVSIIHHF